MPAAQAVMTVSLVEAEAKSSIPASGICREEGAAVGKRSGHFYSLAVLMCAGLRVRSCHVVAELP